MFTIVFAFVADVVGELKAILNVLLQHLHIPAHTCFTYLHTKSLVTSNLRLPYIYCQITDGLEGVGILVTGVSDVWKRGKALADMKF